jgi:cell division septum initiation protein DivIVA
MSGNEPTIESLNADLAELEREVRALSMAQQRPAATGPAAEHAPPSVADAARTAVEDTVAASFVATEEMIDSAGGWFVALSELGAIHNDQAKALLKDALDTLRALRNAHSAADVLRTAFDHWNRRATHVAEGLTRTIEVVARESRHASASVAEMWQPMVDLVRADTRRG